MVKLDTICIQPFGAALQESFLCSGGRHRFVTAMNFLSRVPAGGRTNYLSIAREFISRYEQRGLLIIVSDFFDGAVQRGDRCNKGPCYSTGFNGP